MKATATLRDLRNRFPRIRKLVETEGEVLLTERGAPRYRLCLYSEPKVAEAAVVDYWARLVSSQPEEIAAAQARSLDDENRGDR